MSHHALILLLLAGPVQARQDPVCEPALRTPAANGGHRDSTVRVLFLGNSHTYVNQLPCLVQRLASSLQPRINLEVVAVARDGATLEQHWADSSTRTLVQARAWDFVVLQEQGRRPVQHHELTSAAVRRFADAVRQVGARLVLYIPPVALRGSSELPRITAVYRQIAAATQSTIAPVAQAWEDVGRADSTLRLHGADGVHASATGSYLSACVLLAVITARSPDRVAPLLLRRPYGSAPATVAIPDTIERSRATALQAAAWRAVRESSAILHQSSPLRPAESTWKARHEPSSEQASSSSSVAKCGRPRELGLEASEDRVERCSSVSLESKRDRLVAGSGAAEGAAVTG